MLDSRRGTGVVVAVMGLVGCFSGNATSPTDATPAVSLVGPTWRVTSIEGQPVLSGTTITAEFSTEERVAGTSGCNRYFGSAKAESGRIAMGPFGATLMACSPDDVMKQEGPLPRGARSGEELHGQRRRAPARPDGVRGHARLHLSLSSARGASRPRAPPASAFFGSDSGRHSAAFGEGAPGGCHAPRDAAASHKCPQQHRHGGRARSAG